MEAENLAMKIKNNIKDNAILYIFFTLLFLKYGLTFFYYPILDDYIQYHGYRLTDNIWESIITGVGTVYVRPLAGLLDPYFWGLMWKAMWVPLIILTLLHFFSAVIFAKTFERLGFKVNSVFYLIYLLMPINIEAVYWISASARIVVGMFFVALSGHLQLRYMDKRSLPLLLSLFLVNIISLGFYEQIIAVGVIYSIFIYMKTYSRDKNKIIFLFLINFLIITAYYITFKDAGNFAARSEAAELNEIAANLPIALDKWKEILFNMNYMIIKSGLSNGISELIATRGGLVLIILAALCILYLIADRGEEREGRSGHIGVLVFAAISIIASFLPVVITKNVYFSFRNIFPSMLGVAIIVSALTKLVNKKIVKAVVVVSIFIFTVANIYEVGLYKKVYEADKKISEGIIKNLTEEVLEGKREVALIGARPSYVELSVYYNEHISNITGNDWALTGGVRSYAGSRKIKRITPYEEEPPGEELRGKLVLYIDEGLNVSKIRD